MSPGKELVLQLNQVNHEEEDDVSHHDNMQEDDVINEDPTNEEGHPVDSTSPSHMEDDLQYLHRSLHKVWSQCVRLMEMHSECS